MLRFLPALAGALALSACCIDPGKGQDAGGTGGGGPPAVGGGVSGTGGGGDAAGGGAASTGGGSASTGGGTASTGGGSSSAGGGSSSTGGGSGTGGGGGTPPPPPQVTTGASPSAGPYGSYVTILGNDFTDAGSLQLASGVGNITVQSTSLQLDAGEDWQDSRIVFRYPFPAEGAITVRNPNGTAAAGTFTPSWSPGVGLMQGMDDYSPFPSTYLGAPGTVVGTFRYPDPPLVYGGWGVMIHNGTSPQLFHLDVSGRYVLSIHLVPNSGVQPDGIALVGMTPPDGGSSSRSLYRLTWAAGLPSLQPTGVAAYSALGASTDGTGFFAWAQATDGGLMRVRPPSYAVDKTLAPPTGFGFGGNTSQVAFVAGALVAQWTTARNSGFPFYKHYERPNFAFANAGQTAWGATELAVNEIDGENDSVNISSSADGKMSFVFGGGFWNTLTLSPSNPSYPEVRLPAGGFADAPRISGAGGYWLTTTSTDFAGAACDSAGLHVLRPVPNPQGGGTVAAASAGEVAIWPCPDFGWRQLVVDADGGLYPLVQRYGHIFLVKKR